MNAIKLAVLGAVALLFASAIPIFAIEGLQLSVQSSNVVLSWPSLPDGSETYLIQYRNTLDATDSWTTLADYYPAATETNVTFFVHPNIVQYPPGGSDSGTNNSNVVPPPPDSMTTASLGTASATSATPPLPMAMPINGSGPAVPLKIYPPGFDLSGLVIYDPATGEWMNGNGYTVKVTTTSPSGDLQPMAGNGEGTNAQYTGFYRVVRDGAHLVGITNGMTLSGTVTIPVEVGNSYGTLSTISLTENDSPVGDSIQIAPFQLPLALTVNTTLMSNGVHQISASARWDVLGGTNDENGGTPYEADSPPVTVNVSNEISFPNWIPQFGQLSNSLLITAQLAHTNADWTIDVWDSHTNYIDEMSGHTTNGDISVVWNLIGPPPDYISYTNEDFFQFRITTTFDDNTNDPSASSPILYTYKDKDHWSGPGAWVIVAQHAFDNYIGSDDLYDELDGFIVGAQGSGYSVLPSPDGNGHAFALHYNVPQADSDWQAFRQALYNPLSRNLIYTGHGGPDGIGANPNNPNRYISATEIANTLHTMPEGLTNRHALRLVILDGCSTAKGTLPEAFGIIHKENVPGIDYVYNALIPAAFVGWTADKWIGFGLNQGSINYGHIYFIQNVEWWFVTQGKGIHEAVSRAATGPFTPVTGIGADQFRVYGNWDLNFWQYNQ